MKVIAYKGMKSDMTWLGFQYEIGKTYKTDKVKLSECGFHAYLNPRDVLEYYPQYESFRYFKVKLSGEITKCDKYDTKVAATEITILEEINIKDVIKTTEWWKTENVLDLLYWSEGFARIRKDYCLYNFIDKNGKYLSDEWFDWVDDFYDGVAIVKRYDDLYNFIDKEGKYLSDEGFNEIYHFHEGFAVVQRSDYLYNYIDKHGNYLSKEWFNYLGDFSEGFARAERTNDEVCKIDKTGKLHKD